jgi:hypothetical protein
MVLRIEPAPPAKGQIIEPAWKPFYSPDRDRWYFRDSAANLYGMDGGYSTEEIARHAMGEVIRMARAKGARI